ncbi:hypothetical protein ALP52_00823 [Pseudomonas amygdali pv. mori]|uniref:Uncharacterized protein n=1 Tax=Pseudomonas amygdali pv. mori TaxID=34065 RepID=A0A3M5INK3_PSEA0|nr:hypothetical protein [Pseudomonas amygdali]RMT12431.1 hypothetical protein ALP52_00823 [Pseudomonas amygdali pv. mori]
MSKDLDSILDTILALDVETEVNALTASYKAIEAFCTAAKVPFTMGSLRNSKNHLTVDMDITGDMNEWIKANVPSFVVVELVAGTTNGTEGMILDFMIGYSESQNRLEEVKKLQSEAAGKNIEFITYAIFNNPPLIVEHVTQSKLRMLCSIYEPVDDDPEDDHGFTEVYKTEEEIADYARKLAEDDNFYLAKNIGDRVSLAAKKFEGDFLAFDLNRIARESASIYKMQILPAKIMDMVGQGKDHKEIAVLLGESQNKVKQIIAVSSSKL